ncbi:hypothetical protein N826_26745 [Skermanella aerolata KACC 11604]|nr:hypothetical protein N826_26745 [Skermanella aerolata KACC 11604]
MGGERAMNHRECLIGNVRRLISPACVENCYTMAQRVHLDDGVIADLLVMNGAEPVLAVVVTEHTDMAALVDLKSTLPRLTAHPLEPRLHLMVPQADSPWENSGSPGWSSLNQYASARSKQSIRIDVLGITLELDAVYAGLTQSPPSPHYYRLVVGFGLLSEDNPSLADLTDGIKKMLDTARARGMMTPGSERLVFLRWHLEHPETGIIIERSVLPKDSHD